MAMIKAILDGQHNAEELVKLCDVRIVSKKQEEVLKASMDSINQNIFLHYNVLMTSICST